MVRVSDLCSEGTGFYSESGRKILERTVCIAQMKIVNHVVFFPTERFNLRISRHDKGKIG